MYSYEVRVRAVQLYIKYGRSAAASIRELGYPSRKNLARWYRAFVELAICRRAIAAPGHGTPPNRSRSPSAVHGHRRYCRLPQRSTAGSADAHFQRVPCRHAFAKYQSALSPSFTENANSLQSASAVE